MINNFRAYTLFLLMQIVSLTIYAQTAEYNYGNNYVYSNSTSALIFTQTWGKLTGIDFVNTPAGTLMNQGAVWYTGNFENDGTVGYVKTLTHYPSLSYFSGTTAQAIKGSGTTLFHNIAFQGVSFSLEQDITIDSLSDFTSGIITSKQTALQTPANSVLMLAGSSWLNASDASFVNGFVQKTGNTAFTFPIGHGGYFRPASISAPSTATDAFTARYIYADPNAAGYSTGSKAKGVGIVSNKEYWIIQRTNGSSFPQVTLTWHTGKTSASVPTDLSKLQVVRWNGTQWISEGNSAATGNSTAGSITANTTGFGVFSLATVLSHVVAVNDTFTMVQGAVLKTTVATNDTVSTGINTWAVTSTVRHGTVTMQTDGSFVYTPDPTFSGKDSLIYTLTDSYGADSTARVILNVKSISGYVLINKHSTEPQLQPDGTFLWDYNIILTNKQNILIDSIHVTDDLTAVFPSPIAFTVTGITATGSLHANGLYNGVSPTNLLLEGKSYPSSQLAGYAKDSITISLKVNPNEFVGEVFNQGLFDATSTAFGTVSSIFTDDDTNLSSSDPRRKTPTNIRGAVLSIPNAFSPNGDGHNDTFEITHPSGSKLSLEVFNRWGGRVYKNNNYQNDWDGTGSGSLLGSNLPEGTYYYLIIETNTKTQHITKHAGFVTLRR
jgi:gliding motility-associated-like protein